MTILDQISLIAQGVDPSTGELFDISILNSDPEIRKAIRVLNSVSSRKPEPQNSIPFRNSEIEISEIAERLRALRRDISAAAALPSYCIFTDKTLNQLASMRITSKPQLLYIYGINRKRYEQYGDAIFAVLSDYC
jgi:superfamily II DNA helicase RecQ